jgi:hypothetical protein
MSWYKYRTPQPKRKRESSSTYAGAGILMVLSELIELEHLSNVIIDVAYRSGQ